MNTSVSNQVKAIAKILDKEGSFIIVGHENPDGDSLGAQFALALSLISIGKRVKIFSKNQVPKIYDFLPGMDLSIQSDTVLIKNESVLISLDCSELERTGLSFSPKLPDFIINIDHHITNSGYGNINLVNTSASATSELIYHILLNMGIKPSAEAATNLYTGILTDTGSFQYSNTSSDCLKVASHLVALGADPYAISLAVYDRKTIPALRLIGIVLNQMEIYQNTVAILTVTKGILEMLNATYEDTEDLVSIPQKTKDIKLSVLIKELSNGEYKISFRTKGNLDASKIAGVLGGGGHPNAAGAKLKGDLPLIKDELLSLIDQFIAEYNREG